MKYLYKYTSKGPDRACLQKIHDEVSDYFDSRYVGAPEAAWRLMGFELHGQSHAVERLPVHLPLHQSVQFTPGQEQASVNRAIVTPTKLEAWLSLNASAPSLEPDVADLICNLRYPEIPSHFTWDSKHHRWLPRKQRPRNGTVVGRISHVKPGFGELFYLRILLLRVTGEGAVSWGSLRSSTPIRRQTRISEQSA